MREREGKKLRLGVSACLLGQEVRYDGGHKRDAFLTETLGPFVEWVPVCPEVEIGLGIPRATLRLVRGATAPRLVVEKTGEDLTARMRRYAEAKLGELAALGLDGYVLKRASPSCGLFRVRVHRARGAPARAGRGLYARALVARFPLLPVEEEGRLADPTIRENFLERVWAAARWRAFLATAPRRGDLVAFHAAQELALLAHSPARLKTLRRLVATPGPLTRARLARYGARFMETLAVGATRARHAEALRRLVGVLARVLDAPARAELARLIREYRRGRVPLRVPLTLARRYVRRLDLRDLAAQSYLDPHPHELLPREHV